MINHRKVILRFRRLAAPAWILFLFIAWTAVRAQVPPEASPPDADDGMAGMKGMDHTGHHPGGMSGMFGPYPHTREGSGTSWVPESLAMEGIHIMRGGWMTMIHGNVNLIYDHAGGPRGGDDKFFSTSMLMVMSSRSVGNETFGLRGMISLDPAMGPGGYPLLLQTGETGDGVTPLIDRQHPHDFFMELAGSWSHRFSESRSLFVYAGLPGEPALGPPAFMHRFSGEHFPAAPITHHWLDSTHVTFGVVTLGWVAGDFKLEGSTFRGREPDEKRWNIESPKLDSYSFRVSWNPAPDWAFQASRGHIVSPEALHADENVDRTTVSVIKNWHGGEWLEGQTTFAWGRNEGEGPAQNGFLLETTLRLRGRHTVMARAERATKSELFPPGDPRDGLPHTVHEATLGYLYEFPQYLHTVWGLGFTGSRAFVPASINPDYGGSPTSGMAFLRMKFR